MVYNANHALHAWNAQGGVDVEQELVRREAVRDDWECDQQPVRAPQLQRPCTAHICRYLSPTFSKGMDVLIDPSNITTVM